MERLALERKNLVDSVKKLDEAMLALRAVAGTSPAVAQTVPNVLAAAGRGAQERRGGRAPAVDGLHRAAGRPARPPRRWPRSPAAATMAHLTVPAAGHALRGPGRQRAVRAQVEAELATVPEPQQPLAAMLPLGDLPPGWTVGKLGEQHLETFNADNLFEKIDGRAESFLQYGVQGDGLRLLSTRPATTRPRCRSTSSRWATRSRRWASTARRSRRSSRCCRSGRKGTPRPAARSSIRARTTPRSSRRATTPSSPTSPWTWPSGSPRSRKPAAPVASAAAPCRRCAWRGNRGARNRRWRSPKPRR